jgi:hypothetical protein
MPYFPVSYSKNKRIEKKSETQVYYQNEAPPFYEQALQMVIYLKYEIITSATNVIEKIM